MKRRKWIGFRTNAHRMVNARTKVAGIFIQSLTTE